MTRHGPVEWSRAVGLRTPKDEFDKVVWHNEHHIGQIETALHALTTL